MHLKSMIFVKDLLRKFSKNPRSGGKKSTFMNFKKNLFPGQDTYSPIFWLFGHHLNVISLRFTGFAKKAFSRFSQPYVHQNKLLGRQERLQLAFLILVNKIMIFWKTFTIHLFHFFDLKGIRKLLFGQQFQFPPKICYFGSRSGFSFCCTPRNSHDLIAQNEKYTFIYN